MHPESIRSIGGSVFNFMRAGKMTLMMKGWVLHLNRDRPRRHRATYIPVED